MFESFHEAQKRIPTQRLKIIDRLREAGEDGLTTAQLNQICFRYGARLAELYKEGYVITKEALTDGLYKYILKAVPGDIKYFANAEDQFLATVAERFNKELAAELADMLMGYDFKIVRNPGWYQRKFDLH
jgi:hypothetical protein